MNIQLVEITAKDTEVSVELPANTKGYSLTARDGVAFRFGFEEGEVEAGDGKFVSMPEDTPFQSPYPLTLSEGSRILYLASSDDGIAPESPLIIEVLTFG